MSLSNGKVEEMVWVRSCFFPRAQGWPIPGNLSSSRHIHHDRRVEQVSSVQSMVAAVRLSATYVASTVVRSKLQAAAGNHKHFLHGRKGHRLLHLPAQPLLLSSAAPLATGMLNRRNQTSSLALKHTGTAQLESLQLKSLTLQHRVVTLGLPLGMAPGPCWPLTNTKELLGRLLLGMHQKTCQERTVQTI